MYILPMVSERYVYQSFSGLGIKNNWKALHWNTLKYRLSLWCVNIAGLVSVTFHCSGIESARCISQRKTAEHKI